MGELDLPRVPFKSLPAPFLRILPTIFAYARLSVRLGPDTGPDVHERYVSHLRVLAEMMTAAARDAGLGAKVVTPLVSRCRSVGMLRGVELAEGLGKIIEGMQAFYEDHRESLKKAIAGAPDLYRVLYRTEIGPKKILAVYAGDTWDRSQKMGDKLTNRCWYDYQRHNEDDGMVRLSGIDFVLLAPGMRPIRKNIEDAVAAAKIPLAVLGGWSKTDDLRNMAELRTAFRYRQSGYRVLHGPFAPVGLYQTIDTVIMENLAWLHATGRLSMTAAY